MDENGRLTEIVYRPFRESDAEQVQSLFSAAFGEPKNPEQWSWEFFAEGRKALIVVAELGDKIVGHYAMLPRDYIVGDRVVRSALVVDVMTHPDFGRRGIFTKSGLKAFDLARSEGIQMLVGFPNEAAIRGHIKLEWSELGRVFLFARPLDGMAIASVLARRMRFPKVAEAILQLVLSIVNSITLGSFSDDVQFEWYEGSEIDSIAGELQPFFDTALRPYPIRLRREIQWLKWRLSDPRYPSDVLVVRDPTSRSITGYLALKVKDKEGLKAGAIVDLLTAPPDKNLAKVLLREGLRKAKEAGCTVAVSMGSPCACAKIPYSSVLMFRTPRSLRFIVRDVGGAGLPELAKKLEHWHLSFLDHDIF